MKVVKVTVGGCGATGANRREPGPARGNKRRGTMEVFQR
jgi:hypothetical protein